MNKFYILLIVVAIFRIVLSFGSFHPDLRNHMDWGERFFQYGANEFYAPDSNVWDFTWPNQPPGTTLMFAGVYQLFQLKFSILTLINQAIPLFPSTLMFFFEDNLYPSMLKLPAILADFGIAFLVYKIVKEHSKKLKYAKMGMLFFLLNPVVWYNSSVWGQYDSVINLFALLSLYLLYRNKVVFGLLAFAICLYIKVSLIIFAPVLLIILLRNKTKITTILKAFIVSFALLSFITFFFSMPENPVTWLVDLYKEKVLGQQLHVITANAFNLWAILTGIHEQPNTLLFGPITYSLWGYILYIPVYLWSLYLIWKRNNEISTYKLVAVIAFGSFILLTNMHERYLYPLFPYLTIIVAMNPRLNITYWVISFISLLNMYNYWFTPNVPFLVSLLEQWGRIVPRILGLINTVLFGYLLHKFTLSKS